MLFCKLEGVSFEISKKLKFSIEPFFCDVINDVIGAIFFFFFSKVGHVIYRWKGCLKLIKIHIRNRARTSSGEIYAIFYFHVTKITDSLSSR